MTKARFTQQQKNVLFLAFEKGFLCDNKNYTSLSEITGLTKKQISNWSRSQIRKRKEEELPKKNFSSLTTIFKELSGFMIRDSKNLHSQVHKNKQLKHKPQQIDHER